MDAVDLQIIRELQADGRLSNQDLADRVRLSPSPACAVCGGWRRRV